MSVQTPPALIPRILRWALNHGFAIVAWAAFWMAVVLPVAYLPLFVALKYAYLTPEMMLGIISLNVLALLLGHYHEPSHHGDNPRSNGVR